MTFDLDAHNYILVESNSQKGAKLAPNRGIFEPDRAGQTRPDPTWSTQPTQSRGKQKASCIRTAGRTGTKDFSLVSHSRQKTLEARKSSRGGGEAGAILGSHHQTLDGGLDTKRKREKRREKRKERRSWKRGHKEHSKRRVEGHRGGGMASGARSGGSKRRPRKKTKKRAEGERERERALTIPDKRARSERSGFGGK